MHTDQLGSAVGGDATRPHVCPQALSFLPCHIILTCDDSDATEISEAECCSPLALDRTAAPCGPRLDLGVVGMLLLLCCHEAAEASRGCRCPGLLVGDRIDGEVLADAAMLTGGGGIADCQALAADEALTSAERRQEAWCCCMQWLWWMLLVS